MNEFICKWDNGGVVVNFELEINVIKVEVFVLLMINVGLVKWFNELEVGELGVDGYLFFVMIFEEKIIMLICVFEIN